MTRPWWADSVGYEVYLRSFADSDGDGVGDLRGVCDRLQYLSWLGVDVVWITPFYPSPMRDHGYDVSDYREVETLFGSLADLEELVARAHDLGLRVLIDLVPNHTSSEHPWFRQARSARDNPYRDHYLWRDPAPDGGPPNNWVSHFGGPAWTFDEATGQYWCHLFLPEQPDLNWRNPAVADEFDDILRFWLDRGVDGFRVDVAHALFKHPEFPDLPRDDGLEEGPVPGSEHARLRHVHDVDQPEVLSLYRRWRKVVEPHGALLLGEVYLMDLDRVVRYVADDDGLHLSFWFRPLHLEWDVDALRGALIEASYAAPGRLAWVQACHDRPRPVTRFGGGRRGRARSLALATLMLGLPGVPFVYQGEELGLADGEVPPELAQDPIAVRAHDFARSRDGCRTPMPWRPGPGWGFTDAARPWLPFAEHSAADTVEAQRGDPDSTLHRYRRLIGLRRGHPDLRADVPVRWHSEAGPVLAYRRGSVVVAANCGDEPATLRLPAGQDGPWTVAFATDRAREGQAAGEQLRLASCEGVVVGAGGVSGRATAR